MAYFKKVKIFYQKNSRSLRILLLVTILAAIIYNLPQNSSKLRVKIGECQFQSEVASTPAAQYQGLSHREDLRSDKAMLFLFTDIKERSFVMRDMYFPLDIIFINNHQVVSLWPNLIPEGPEPKKSYSSGGEVDAVLEIKGGLSRKCKIKVGTQVTWK